MHRAGAGLLFIAAARVDDLIYTGHVTGPPDIVVEVLSPSSRTYDGKTKFKIHASHGVPKYWIVDPANREIAVFALMDGAYERQPMNPEGSVTSRLLPGLMVNPTALFATIPVSTGPYGSPPAWFQVHHSRPRPIASVLGTIWERNVQ